MFPVFLPKQFAIERIHELFNRIIQIHKSHVAGMKMLEVEEGLYAMIPDPSNNEEGVIVYLTQAELQEFDAMNESLLRISGHCDNNIQCYVYTPKD